MCTGLGVLFHRVIGGLDLPIHSLYSPLRPWSSAALRERKMLVARPGGSIHRFHPHFTIQNSVMWVHRISGECGKYNPILCPETKGAGLGASPQSSEKAMAPHSTLAWKIPWTEEPGRLQSMGSLRVTHNWATSLSIFTFMHWRRKWQPTPVFLPGESQGRGSLVGCRLWGRTESDTTEAT